MEGRKAKKIELIPEEVAVEDNETGGREIRGLEPKLERFKKLESGVDYKLSIVNEKISTEANPEDYILFASPSNGDVSLLVVPPHWRTITAPIAASFHNESGQKHNFFEANTKGVGYLKPSLKNESLDAMDSWHDTNCMEGERVLGINSERPGAMSAKNKMGISNHLLAQGLRVEAHWAVAKLQRIPYRGEMFTMDELIQRGLFPRKFDKLNLLVRPIELVRLFKTNTRIEEALLSDERRQEIFSQAFELHNRESELTGKERLNIGNRRQEQDFFRSFSYKIGSNLAILLNEGFAHGSIHSSNITMAAELVDIDPLCYWEDDKIKSGWKEKFSGLRLHHIKDFRDAIYSLRRLFKAARRSNLSTGTRESLVENLLNGFNEKLDSKKMITHDIDNISARQWLVKIAEHCLIQRKNLPSLLNQHIDEWKIS